MKRWKCLLVLIVAVVCAGASALHAQRRAPRPVMGPTKGTAPSAGVVSIGEAKGVRRLQLLDKRVTLEGFYFNESVPMLVEDMDLTLRNAPLPPGSYVVLSGPAPEGVSPGDRIQVQGSLRQPGRRHPTWMQSEKAVLDLGAGAEATVLARATKPRKAASPTRIETAPPPRAMSARSRALPKPGPPSKYALLICGGEGENYHWRFRYSIEMIRMYNFLRDHGYTPSSIVVLYGNGADLHASVQCDGPATRAGISEAFDRLADVMTEEQSLFIMTVGPGGGFYQAQQGDPDDTPSGVWGGVLDEDGDEAHEWTMENVYHQDLNGDGDTLDRVGFDEVLFLAGGESITDDEFASEVSKITSYGKMIFLMGQGFAGGFCHDLAGPNRIIMTACAEKQCAWALHGEPMSEFMLQYLRALREVHLPAALLGLPPSVATAFNSAYRADRIRPLETPTYDDDGAPPPHTGQVGEDTAEGALGFSTRL
jgi:hypothetical protein